MYSITEIIRSYKPVCFAIVGSSQISKDEAVPVIEYYLNLIAFGTSPFDLIISGECHKGGVDIHVKDYCIENQLAYKGYPAKRRKWLGDGGFRERNTQMAIKCTHMLCIHTFKSETVGGLWTVNKAIQLRRQGYVEFIK